MNGCMNCPMTSGALRRRIWAYDFAIHEMVLFLDTHPHDASALDLLHAYRRKRAELVETYEAHFGPYVVVTADVKGDCWSWVDDPWPWEFTGKE